MQRIGQIAPGDAADLQKLAVRGGGGADKAPFRSSVDDFYFTNADRALFGGDGGMFGDRARARAPMTAAE